jgi:hypothetical protein
MFQRQLPAVGQEPVGPHYSTHNQQLDVFLSMTLPGTLPADQTGMPMHQQHHAGLM